MKIVINTKFGGFGLSDAAYERFIELGLPVRKYLNQPFNSKTKRYEKVAENEGEIIFDRELTPEGEDEINDLMYYKNPKSSFFGRYWDAWINDRTRTHPLLIQVVEELGNKASGPLSELKVVEVPDGIDWEISEYDGRESVEEVHRSWS